MTSRTLVLACGALAHEVRALLNANQLSHIHLHCLPAQLHNSPQKIPDAVRAAVEKFRPEFDHILIAYADCGTGGALAKTCAELNVEMISGPHCYAFFQGQTSFAANAPTAFYLTDFLARQFDAMVWRPLGLDAHPELRDMYFGNYERVIFLAQTEDAALTAKAKDAAFRLGLEFERRFTGYGELGDWLAAPRASS